MSFGIDIYALVIFPIREWRCLSSHSIFIEWRSPHLGEEPFCRDHPTIIPHSSCKVSLEMHASSINSRTHLSQQPMFLIPSPNLPSSLIPSPAHNWLLEADRNNQANFQAWNNPVSRQTAWGEPVLWLQYELCLTAGWRQSLLLRESHFSPQKKDQGRGYNF